MRSIESLLLVVLSIGGIRNFIWRLLAQGVWYRGLKSLSGVHPISLGFEEQSPPKAEAVCRHRLQILTAERSKFENFCTIYPDSWPDCSMVGAK